MGFSNGPKLEEIECQKEHINQKFAGEYECTDFANEWLLQVAATSSKNED